MANAQDLSGHAYTNTVQVMQVESGHRSNHYSALDGIAPEEWDEIFDRVGQPWEPDDDTYLLEWYGRDDIVSLSYALGRTPWTVVRRYNRLTCSEQQMPVKRVRHVSITFVKQADFLTTLFEEGD